LLRTLPSFGSLSQFELIGEVVRNEGNATLVDEDQQQNGTTTYSEVDLHYFVERLKAHCHKLAE
ncbi:hypothetical protein FRC01_010284, partial [Tulasnella sp. 417]